MAENDSKIKAFFKAKFKEKFKERNLQEEAATEQILIKFKNSFRKIAIKVSKMKICCRRIIQRDSKNEGCKKHYKQEINQEYYKKGCKKWKLIEEENNGEENYEDLKSKMEEICFDYCTYKPYYILLSSSYITLG